MILKSIIVLATFFINLFLVSIAVSSIIIRKNTNKGFLKTDYQIEMALLRNRNQINFWIGIVIAIEFFITLYIIDHVIH